MGNPATNEGANSGRGVSARIWGDCPVEDLLRDNNTGVWLDDDFTSFNLTGAAAASNSQVGQYSRGWTSYQDDTSTLRQIATNRYGVVEMTTSADDEEEVELISGGGTGGLILLDTVANSGKKMWFEARISVSSIADIAVAIGLAEEASQANSFFTDTTGALADKDFVGFRMRAATDAYLDAVFNTASGGGETVKKNQAQLMVASTWYKLGMKFDPAIGCQWFVDGVQVGTNALASATNFPNGEELAVLFGVKTHTTAAKSLYVDWVRVAQLI